MLKTSGQIADEVLCALYKMAAPPAAAPAVRLTAGYRRSRSLMMTSIRS